MRVVIASKAKHLFTWAITPLLLRSIAITLCLGSATTTALAGTKGTEGPFLPAEEVTWKVNEFNVSRWKTLVGGAEGGQLDDADIQFGLWELAPRAIYHSHRHEAPEIYYITGGRAKWTVGEESREVSAGMTILTAPGQVHRMENLTDEPVSAIWIWWAPGGDREVFAGEYYFTEPVPVQPEGAGFTDKASERLY